MQYQRGTIGNTAQCIALILLLAGLQVTAWAGKNGGDGQCDRGENANNCWTDCDADTTGNIFQADLVGLLSSVGSIYTRPDQNLSADPKNVAFNSNRGNEVAVMIHTASLLQDIDGNEVFTEQALLDCFPVADDGTGSLEEFMEFEGTLHLNDYFKQRADLAAYFWFWVGDVQYVFEFRDDGRGWSDEFPPSYGETIHRDAWKWLLRVTTRNAENPCVTDGNIVAGSSNNPIVAFKLGSVDACEYPYDGVDCE